MALFQEIAVANRVRPIALAETDRVELERLHFTTHPAAEEKIYDVVGLYLNPPSNAVVPECR